MKYLLSNKRPGAVSLLFVLGIGMVLLVMVSGIAILSVQELRQSGNVDQSNRALQTAESGVKVAVQKLAADPAYEKTDCPPGPDFQNIIPTQTEQQLTCVTVQSKLTSLEGYLEQDRATQVIIETPRGAGPVSMQLRWHSDTLDPILGSYVNATFYPDVADYQAAAAPEITFVRWPNNTPITGAFQIATVFVMPGQADQSTPQNNVTSGCDSEGANKAQYGDYRCVTNDTSPVGFNLDQAQRVSAGTSINSNFAIRIKPRYASTHYQLKVFDASGKEMTMQSTKAIIDITARSGNLYRRIKAEKPIIPTSLENLFDSVLFAGKGSNDNGTTDICKGLIVKEDYTAAPASNPTCTN